MWGVVLWVAGFAVFGSLVWAFIFERNVTVYFMVCLDNKATEVARAWYARAAPRVSVVGHCLSLAVVRILVSK